MESVPERGEAEKKTLHFICMYEGKNYTRSCVQWSGLEPYHSSKFQLLTSLEAVVNASIVLVTSPNQPLHFCDITGEKILILFSKMRVRTLTSSTEHPLLIYEY